MGTAARVHPDGISSWRWRRFQLKHIVVWRAMTPGMTSPARLVNTPGLNRALLRAGGDGGGGEGGDRLTVRWIGGLILMEVPHLGLAARDGR